MNKKYLIIIAGPTAIGKTSLSIDIAKHFQTEILSCDSRQFFKEMSIGTAVPNKEELAIVPHHFIHNLSVQNEYSVGMFERDVLQKIEELHQKFDVLVMVGGSGLYVDAVCRGLDDFPRATEGLRDDLNKRHSEEGIEPLEQQLKELDPEYHETVDKANPHRIIRALEVCITSGQTFTSFRKKQIANRPFETVKIILNRDRELLYERINLRVDLMLEEGLLEEAKALYPLRELNALQTVGYKELFSYFDGEIDLESAVSEIKKNTRRYAKRQLTWFRRDPETVFFNPEEPSEIWDYLKERIKTSS